MVSAVVTTLPIEIDLCSGNQIFFHLVLNFSIYYDNITYCPHFLLKESQMNRVPTGISIYHNKNTVQVR